MPVLCSDLELAWEAAVSLPFPGGDRTKIAPSRKILETPANLES